ncbi:MAG: hypothetical protein KY467_08125 [Gemmatimonadetes bacterium]|nr:hypothetical protein [Gemmatimonadota bacterium]
MKKTGIPRLAFAAATSVALAFGASQAVAAPSTAKSAGEAACTDRQCRQACAPFGGYCDELRGVCVCEG